jgi:hypothetical protein
MSEKRFEILEESHISLRKDLSVMAAETAKIDKVLSVFISKMEGQFNGKASDAQTLNNIQSTVNEIHLQIAREPHERDRAISLSADKLWKDLRNVESKTVEHIAESAMDIKFELKNSLRSHISLALTLIAVICSIGAYTYISNKNTMEYNILQLREESRDINKKIGRIMERILLRNVP